MNYNTDSILVSGITNLNIKNVPIMKNFNINISEYKINGIYNYIFKKTFDKIITPLYKQYKNDFWIKFKSNSKNNGNWILFIPYNKIEIILYVSPDLVINKICNGPNNDENWLSTNNLINTESINIDYYTINVKRITDIEETSKIFDIDFFIFDTIYVSFLKQIENDNDFSFDPFSGIFVKKFKNKHIYYQKIICDKYKIIKENDEWFFIFSDNDKYIKLFKALNYKSDDEIPFCYWEYNNSINSQNHLKYLSIHLSIYNLLETTPTSSVNIDLVIKELNNETEKFINNII